jgi:hypothetical protein
MAPSPTTPTGISPAKAKLGIAATTASATSGDSILLFIDALATATDGILDIAARFNPLVVCSTPTMENVV